MNTADDPAHTGFSEGQSLLQDHAVQHVNEAEVVKDGCEEDLHGEKAEEAQNVVDNVLETPVKTCSNVETKGSTQSEQGDVAARSVSVTSHDITSQEKKESEAEIGTCHGLEPCSPSEIPLPDELDVPANELDVPAIDNNTADDADASTGNVKHTSEPQKSDCDNVLISIKDTTPGSSNGSADIICTNQFPEKDQLDHNNEDGNSSNGNKNDTINFEKSVEDDADGLPVKDTGNLSKEVSLHDTEFVSTPQLPNNDNKPSDIRNGDTEAQPYSSTENKGQKAEVAVAEIATSCKDIEQNEESQDECQIGTIEASLTEYFSSQENEGNESSEQQIDVEGANKHVGEDESSDEQSNKESDDILNDGKVINSGNEQPHSGCSNDEQKVNEASDDQNSTTHKHKGDVAKPTLSNKDKLDENSSIQEKDQNIVLQTEQSETNNGIIDSKSDTSEDCQVSATISKGRTSRSSSESRNVFQMFPVQQDASHMDSVKDEVNDEKASNSEVTNSVNISNDYIGSFETFIKKQTDVGSKNSTKCQRKPIFKPKSGRRHRSLDKSCQEEVFVSKENIIEKAKLKYPGLKELRIDLSMKDLVDPAKKISEEKPSKTVSKKFIGRSTKQKDHKRDQISEKNASKNQSTRGLAHELKLLHEPSIHHKISAQYSNDRSKPLKKRTRHGLDGNEQVDLKDTNKIDFDNSKPADNIRKSKLEKPADIPEKVKKSLKSNSAGKLLKDNSKIKTGDKLTNRSKNAKAIKEIKSKDSKTEKAKTVPQQKQQVKGKCDSSSKRITCGSTENKQNEKMEGTLNVLKAADRRTGEAESVTCKTDKQIDTKVPVVKKYPERTCKARLSVNSYNSSKQSEETQKTKHKTLSLSKATVHNSYETNTEKSAETAEPKTVLLVQHPDSKSKKKRKRKVKPWSWGNEKKRYKPKLKVQSDNIPRSETSESDTVSSNLVSDEAMQENSGKSETDHQKKCEDEVAGTNSEREMYLNNNQEHDLVHEAQTLADSLSSLVRPNSNSKKSRRNSLVIKKRISRHTETHNMLNIGSQSDHENPDSGNHLINNPPGNLIQINDGLEQEHVPEHDEKSSDSGIQSLAGSPAGNESPNSVSSENLSANGNKTSKNCLKTLCNSHLLPSSASSVVTNDKISISSNELVSSVLCATASSSVSSFSVTTSVKSMSETTTVYSKNTPLSSPVVSTSSAYTCLNVNTTTNSASLSDSRNSVSSCVNSAHSPSKKKNRAKFLQSRKSSTLLQKGRLPTEEEKEQRLEDKFDYLSRNCAKEKCDNCTTGNNEHSLIKNSNTLDVAASAIQNSANFAPNVPLNSSSDLTTINVNDILPSEHEDDRESHFLTNSPEQEIVEKIISHLPLEVPDVETYKHKKKKKSKKKNKRKRSHLETEPTEVKKGKYIEEEHSDIKTDENESAIENNFKEHEDCVKASCSMNTEHAQVLHESESELPKQDDKDIELETEVTPVPVSSESENFCQDIVNSLVAIVENYSSQITDSYGDNNEELEADLHSTEEIETTSRVANETDNEKTEHQEPISECEDNDDNLDNEIDENLNAMENPEFEIRNVIDGIQTVIENWDNDDHSPVDELSDKIITEGSSDTSNITAVFPLQRKRGRPPNKRKKSKILTLQKYKNKYRYISFNKFKCKAAQPPHKVHQEMFIKRGPGRPKGSKNRVKSNVVKEKRPRGRPKGALNKVKKLNVEQTMPNGSAAASVQGAHEFESLQENGFAPPVMMQWRESRVMPGLGEEKKKRGRPRKRPLPEVGQKPKKRGRPVLNKNKLLHDIHSENDSSFKKIDNVAALGPSLDIRRKPGKKKGFKQNKLRHPSSVSDALISPGRLDQEMDTEGHDFSVREPAQSISSHDSDNSGVGSNLCAKTSAIQLWMEMSKHRRKKNKKKMFHFKSKHKNIVDPVFIAEVDLVTDVFPSLAISPSGETYLRVRPGEVPLPSIFKIVRIDVKKKKKDKLFVFEKAKPLKPKNDELSTKDKIKLGRRISILGESSMDLDDGSGQRQCNLPPKKRHKLFSIGAGDDGKPERRKVGRPRKQSAPHQPSEFAFGDVQRKKDTFKLGDDGSDDISFASVAKSGSSAAFSPPRPQVTGADPVSMATTLTFTTKVGSVARSGNGHKVTSGSSVTCGQMDLTSKDSSKDKTVLKGSLLGGINLSSEATVSVDDADDICDNDSNDLEVEKINASANHRSDECAGNRNNLKRKHVKSDKLKSTKKAKKRKLPGDGVTEGGAVRTSRQTICPESQPLPTIHREDGCHSDPDDDDGNKGSKRRGSAESRESDTSIVKKQSTLQKKRYQKAGLYSDSYKDESGVKEKDMSSMIFSFDPPLHFGHHMLRTVTDFQLPYDTWWLHYNDMLPKKGDGQQYRKIRNNIYVDARPSCPYEAHTCNCSVPLGQGAKGCGEDCLNRLIYSECFTDMCPCGPACSNQAIQKRQFAPGLQKFLTKERGFGVRTIKPIKGGDLVTEYVGEVVSEQEFRRRMTEEYSQECHHYCLNLDGGMVIDGYRMGNVARFINHSCEPNCEMQKWNVNGMYHMCLYAQKDIEPGTELVYDYNFQSFNHDAQQICKCGSQVCRGLIGGRTKAKAAEKGLSKVKGKHQKDKRKSKVRPDKIGENNKHVSAAQSQSAPVFGNQLIPPFISQLSIKKKERLYARMHAIFLVRNLDKLRQKFTKEPVVHKHANEEDYVKGTHFTKKDVITTQLTALKTSRSVKTRRQTVAEEDLEVGKMARLAGVCHEDENVLAIPDLYHLPARKKHPWYYQVIQEPIDLTMIENRILSGEYTSLDDFEKDVMKLFNNVETYCGKKSKMGDNMRQLRAVYSTAKQSQMYKLQEILGAGEARVPDPGPGTVLEPQGGAMSDLEGGENMQVATPTMSVSSESDISEVSDNKGEWVVEDEEEEVIRCICGIYKDEGLMIQCEKCYIWQHTDCMKVKGDEDNYLCDECEPRPIDREVEIVPNSDDEDEMPDDGNRYFMTLMRDDMQIRLGSCVYVMKENQSKRYSYKKSGGLNKDKMDIFRIERLWKNDKGEKFAFGHTYVRPHETFHEPNRKFFPNEVFRTPLYEIFPLDSIVGYCCVLDLLTYCKGRPKGHRDDDIYICEYRMDKTLHLFYKISPKQRIPVNTKSYCFEMYEKRLNPKRTYSPHEVPESYKRNWREKSTSSTEGGERKADGKTAVKVQPGINTPNMLSYILLNWMPFCKEGECVVF
ncbi:ASH1L-like protein [Mya arenaria]|uniref:ASH1L-like protein n=1 Tax=Mya arenaria TaxID=6604 RepID=A0ABY7DVQ3_MYAAR|nr:ASH1L-like protein [Mya arenaria]